MSIRSYLKAKTVCKSMSPNKTNMDMHVNEKIQLTPC